VPSQEHVLVTGAEGFVGRHLCRALYASGFKLSCVGRGAGMGVGDHYALDLLNDIATNNLITKLKPNYVVHLAGIKIRDADLDAFRPNYDINIRCAWNAIDACLALPNFKRFIFFGSGDEYGCVASPYKEAGIASPVSAYGLSKLATTQILGTLFRSNGFPAVVLRPSVIYGPGQGLDMFIPTLIHAVLAGRSFGMTEGAQFRDFVYVSDVVDAVIRAIKAEKCVDGEVINIGAGQSHTIKSVVGMILGELSCSQDDLIKYGSLPYRACEVMNYAMSIEQASKLLNWRPEVGLLTGLRSTIRYYSQLDYEC
jgi:UDP-glucose 4-epimerase